MVQSSDLEEERGDLEAIGVLVLGKNLKAQLDLIGRMKERMDMLLALRQPPADGEFVKWIPERV